MNDQSAPYPVICYNSTETCRVRQWLARDALQLCSILICSLVAFSALARNDGRKSLGESAIVYVESNRADNNSILAFRRDAVGQLTPAGEFPTGGKGVFDLSLALG